MNYQKKYEVQKKINSKLLQQNKALKTTNDNLLQEIEYLKTYNTASGDEARKIIEEITDVKNQLCCQFEALSQVKSDYQNAVNEAVALKKTYRKQFERFKKSMQKSK